MVDISVMLNECFPGEVETEEGAPCARCGVFVSSLRLVSSFDRALRTAKEIHAEWHVMIEA